MNIQHIVKTLQDHAKEEARIHKAVFRQAGGDVKNLFQKHLKDTMSIHKAFWKELKKAVKEK